LESPRTWGSEQRGRTGASALVAGNAERPAIIDTVRPIYLAGETKLEIVSDRQLKIKQVKLSKGGILRIEVFNATTSLPDSIAIDKGILRAIAFEAEDSELRIYVSLTEPVIYEVEGTDQGVTVVFQNPLLERFISVDYNDESLSTILLMLSKQYGANIVAGSNISGRVTVHLENVPIKVALSKILEAEGYGYVEEDGLIRVLTIEELAEIKAAKVVPIEKPPVPEPESKLFELEFASVAEIEGILQKLIGAEGNILSDPRTNSVIVVSSPENILVAEEIITKLDKEVAGQGPVLPTSVIPEEPAQEEIPVKRVFKLNYISPIKAKAILEGFLTPEGTIEVIEEREEGAAGAGASGGGISQAAGAGAQLGEPVGQGGYIVVFDERKIVEEIGREIAVIDVRVPQVEIEAYIVEGTLSEDDELGINWAVINKDEDIQLSFSRDRGALLTKGITEGIIPMKEFTGILNALSTRSDLRVLSNPRITTLEDQPAMFHSGDKIPYSKIFIQEGIEQIETVFEEVGILLTVTPQVKEDDMISLLLSTQVSSEAGFTPAGQPRISTRTTQSQVLVRSGDTVAIAGLISEKTSIAVSKLPIVGDIPLIGKVFSTESELKQRSEVTIFITPRIVIP
jgi:type II secretory pathway component GspD/PulD (secretin)